jgi:hypothetical protein
MENDLLVYVLYRAQGTEIEISHDVSYEASEIKTKKISLNCTGKYDAKKKKKKKKKKI